eukprot:CAMPEP_0174729658 /NCGR_PEP_ID=MMETSP1094-20130205/54091_1 /TAXON_ID=156173 /ORGANISM="Chrysochromulina brevifilum, Strain UTEX LB 985" /LENGTH=475 /DNA_ID=CAMNT_0015931795 /DNA_START=42 /DNA_END=1469 /DNA_ORIENTATION=-
MTSQQRSLSRKEAVWLIIEENTVVNAFVLLVIIFSTTCFVLETEFRDPELDVWWFVFETVSVAVFTIEFIIRILSCPRLRAFILAPLNIIDVLAIGPYYITLFWSLADGVAPWESSASQAAKSTTVLRAIRLFRVFRIFKLGRYSAGMQVFVGALTHSATSLFLLGFLLLITVILFSSIMFLVESETDPTIASCYNSSEPFANQCYFESIPATFWWAIVTITTVGYGDAVPVTPGGKVIASVAMICGIIVIALPISVLGNNFTKLMQQYSDESIIIAQADLDGTGYVDRDEVARWLVEMRKAGKIRDERLTADALIQRYDTGGKVGLERREFLKMCRETVHQGGPSNRELLQKMIRLGDQLANIQERLAKLEQHAEASSTSRITRVLRSNPSCAPASSISLEPHRKASSVPPLNEMVDEPYEMTDPSRLRAADGLDGSSYEESMVSSLGESVAGSGGGSGDGILAQTAAAAMSVT